MMFTQQIALFALAAAPLVTAHGFVNQVIGNLGGNGTAIGVMGAVVPGGGPNGATEKDTTVFNSQNPRTDGDFGKTTAAGQLGGSAAKIASGVNKAMALSGSTLPQVSSGGSLATQWLVITDDGCGPLTALVDQSASGKFSTALSGKVSTTMPGNNGNCVQLDSGDDTKLAPKASIAIAAGKARAMLVKMGVLSKRAKNVNKAFSVNVALPADMNCTGTVGTQTNVCLVKLSNNNKNGPFGGVFAIQQSANGTTTATPAKRATAFTS